MKVTSSPELAELRRKFRIFYQQELKAFFAPMEAERQKYLRRFWTLFIISSIALPAIIVLSVLHFISIDSLPGRNETEFFLISLAILAAVCSAPIISYKKHVKGNVMEKMVQFFGDFSYLHENKIDWDILEKSRLFLKPSSYDGDDYFYGKYKGIGITISEEKHEKRQGKSTYTTFRGIIILLDMDKRFEGKTIVRKKRPLFLNQLHRPAKKRTVKLEDPEFNKRFAVFSNDQVEARYLLTTAFMERMLKVRDAFGAKSIEFSFFDNRLLIKVPTRKDMFEASSLFTSATDYNRIERAFDQFCSVFSIVDMLKLSRRAN